MTPYIGTTAQTPVSVTAPRATSATLTGLTNGDRLHLQGDAPPTPSATERSLASPRARRRRRTRSSTSRRRRRSTPATQARSSSASSSPPGQRHGHRHPLLQGGRQHRHPRRQPVELERHAARLRDVHERNGLGLAAGQLLHARSRSRPARPMSPATSRPTATTRRPPPRSARRRQTTRRCRRSPTERAPTACTPTARRQHVPHEQLQRDQLLGRRAVRAARPPSAPEAPEGVSASPATGQALVSWTRADSNGGSPITGYTVTPYIGAKRRRR